MKAKKNNLFNVVVIGNGRAPYADNPKPLSEADAEEHARGLRQDGYSVMLREAWRIW